METVVKLQVGVQQLTAVVFGLDRFHHRCEVGFDFSGSIALCSIRRPARISLLAGWRSVEMVMPPKRKVLVVDDEDQ